MGYLGDVGSQVLLRGPVNFDDLEGRPDAAGAQAGDDPVVAAVEADDLVLGPEAGWRGGWRRDRVAEQLGKRAIKVPELTTLLRRLRAAGGEDLGGADAHFVVPPRE